METGNAGRTPYEIGFDDNADGKMLDQNPFWNGEFTKFGNRRLSEEGIEWENGFRSRIPPRKCTDKEIREAAKVDVTRFRRKSNRYYK